MRQKELHLGGGFWLLANVANEISMGGAIVITLGN